MQRRLHSQSALWSDGPQLWTLQRNCRFDSAVLFQGGRSRPRWARTLSYAYLNPLLSYRRRRGEYGGGAPLEILWEGELWYQSSTMRNRGRYHNTCHAAGVTWVSVLRTECVLFSVSMEVQQVMFSPPCLIVIYSINWHLQLVIFKIKKCNRG